MKTDAIDKRKADARGKALAERKESRAMRLECHMMTRGGAIR